MSWQVNGRGKYYHNWDEYQAALRQADLSHVRAERDSLLREAGRHRDQVAAVEAELTQARGNAEEMARLNRRLQSGMEDLRRVTTALQASQEQFERRSDESFRQVRAEAEAAREDLAALDRAHQEHQAAVRAEFDKTRVELDAGLRDAEERRRATETRLRSEIAAVDGKFEADKAARLAKAKDDGERAAGLAAYTEERLTHLRPRQDELGIREGLTRVEVKLAAVRELLARGDTTTALAAANDASGEQRTNEREGDARAGDMAADRAFVAETAARLKETLAAPDVRRMFPAEAAEVAAQLDELVARLPATHARWEQSHFRDAAAAHVRDLSEEVRRYASAGPQLAALKAQRDARIQPYLERLEVAFGDFHVHAENRVKGDEKTDKIVRCTFPDGSVVDLEFPLHADEDIRVEGYKEATDGDCHRRAAVVAQILTDLLRVTEQHVDPRARTGPALRHPPAQAAWAGSSDRLKALRGRLS